MKNAISQTKKYRQVLGASLLVLTCTFSLNSEAGKMRGKKGRKAYPSIVDKTIKAAEKCTPKIDAKGIKFCTGFTLSAKDIGEVAKGGVQTCRARIEKAGYKIVNVSAGEKFPKPEWDAFASGTKEGLTLNDERTVAFKPQADLIDCAHEWIHVLQWTRGNDKLLSPRLRSRTLKSLSVSVNGQSDRVEELETAGMKAHAIIQAGKAQEAIDRLKDYELLTDRLDEVEANFFILRYCEKLNCSETDRDTALANLYKRADSLSPQLRAEVESKAQGLIEGKKKVAINEVRSAWHPLDTVQTGKLIETQMKDEWPALVDQLAKAGLKLVSVTFSTDNVPDNLPDVSERIPLGFLKQMPIPTSEENTEINAHKLISITSPAKFFCSAKKDQKPVLFVSHRTTRASLVHEFLRFKQSQLNPDFCADVFGQSDLASSLNSGQMDRQTHDQKILLGQAMNSVSEEEIYKSFLKFRDFFSKPENMSTDLMLNAIEEWLQAKRS